MSEWQPIETAPKDGVTNKVDLWLTIQSSPRSMGWSDSFRVPDAWYEESQKSWVHYDDRGNRRQLLDEYITHWMPLPEPPAS